MKTLIALGCILIFSALVMLCCYAAVVTFYPHTNQDSTRLEQLEKENQQLHQMVNLLIADKVTIRE